MQKINRVALPITRSSYPTDTAIRDSKYLTLTSRGRDEPTQAESN